MKIARILEVEDVAARQTDAEEYLAPIAVALRSKGVRVESRVRRGNPADQIVAAARETGADLIAMSAHGRGGLGRLVFGSVAQAVLRHVAVTSRGRPASARCKGGLGRKH